MAGKENAVWQEIARMGHRETQWILKEKYQGNMTPKAVLDIERVQKGEHVDYMIGFVEFLGCTIDLSKRPMIPRPETEYWVEKIIQRIRSRYAFSSRFIPPAGRSPTRFGRKHSARFSIRCLDLFAGSGCIGIALLKHIPHTRVDFGERDKAFVEQIQINTNINRIDRKRYRIFQSDIFSKIPFKYDCIFANPPYVALSRAGNVQDSVLEQEPLGAIFGGEDGLDYIRTFLKQAKKHLKKHGKIFLEFDSWQKLKIAKLLQECRYNEVEFHRDQYGKWRFLVAS